MATLRVIAYVLGATKVVEDILSQIDSFNRDSSPEALLTTRKEIAQILPGVKDRLSQVQNTNLNKRNAARLGVIFESLLDVQKSLASGIASLILCLSQLAGRDDDEEHAWTPLRTKAVMMSYFQQMWDHNAPMVVTPKLFGKSLADVPGRHLPPAMDVFHYDPNA